jgi:hypothetical protein
MPSYGFKHQTTFTLQNYVRICRHEPLLAHLATKKQHIESILPGIS